MEHPDSENNPPAGGWRIKMGAAVFALSILTPVAGIPLAAGLDLSGELVASISGALLVAGEVLGLAAVAIMGKPGYEYVRGLLLGALRRFGPPRTVSRLRYRAGLVMFCIPILFGWIAPYVSTLINLQDGMVAYAIAGDVLLLASLFVLGGDFWDKLSSLFVHHARVAG